MTESGKQLSEKVKDAAYEAYAHYHAAEPNRESVDVWERIAEAAIAAYRSEHEAEVEGLRKRDEELHRRADLLLAENIALQSRVQELNGEIDLLRKRAGVELIGKHRILGDDFLLEKWIGIRSPFFNLGDFHVLRHPRFESLTGRGFLLSEAESSLRREFKEMQNEYNVPDEGLTQDAIEFKIWLMDVARNS